MTGDNKDLGRLGDADRAGGLRPEPAEQSRPKALIPDAGGQAFPSGDKAAFPTSTFEPGMTLRDWFAGQALPRCLSADYYDSSKGFGARVDGQAHERAAAEAAYRIADAMLAARGAA